VARKKEAVLSSDPAPHAAEAFAAICRTRNLRTPLNEAACCSRMRATRFVVWVGSAPITEQAR